MQERDEMMMRINHLEWGQIKLPKGANYSCRNQRSAEALRYIIESYFRIEQWELFAVYHQYVLCVGTKRLSEDRCSTAKDGREQ
jgi:hypothetical protein